MFHSMYEFAALLPFIVSPQLLILMFIALCVAFSAQSLGLSLWKMPGTSGIHFSL